MTIHHISLYNTDDNKPLTRVVKQELITYEQTEFGLKIAKLERSFTGAEHADSYTSIPLPLKQWGKPKYQLSKSEQRHFARTLNDELIVSIPPQNRRQK